MAKLEWSLLEFSNGALPLNYDEPLQRYVIKMVDQTYLIRQMTQDKYQKRFTVLLTRKNAASAQQFHKRLCRDRLAVQEALYFVATQ